MQHHHPIFIVGAPRSGKKMTSELVGRAAGVFSFPYEINCLWRTGHRRHPYDTLSPAMLSLRTRQRIRDAFDRIAMSSGCDRIVDRTDHNILQFEYVQTLFPDCRIIHVVRDPRGSVASAIKRRRTALQWSYFIKKSRYVPPSDLLYYGIRYALDIAQARCGKDRYRKLWGIRTPITEQYASHHSLAVKCAIQWSESIRHGLKSGRELSSENYLMVRYEDLINRPLVECRKIMEFTNLPWESAIVHWIEENMFRGSLALWKQDLSEEQLSEIHPLVVELMTELGYSWEETTAINEKYHEQQRSFAA